jgi:hypothetical protein
MSPANLEIYEVVQRGQLQRLREQGGGMNSYLLGVMEQEDQLGAREKEEEPFNA